MSRGKRLLSIHRIADKACSRKPLFTLSDAYALGLVLRVDSSPEERFRSDILLHVWMEIHS
jgi:hypothetical protein